MDGYGPGFLRTDNPELHQYLEVGDYSLPFLVSGFEISIQEGSSSVTMSIVSPEGTKSFPSELVGNYYCHSGETGDFVTALFIPGMFRY